MLRRERHRVGEVHEGRRELADDREDERQHEITAALAVRARRVDRVGRETACALAREEAEPAAEPARLQQDEDTEDGRGDERHLHTGHELADRPPVGDAARERHEEQDHGEQPDHADDALDGQHGGALDRPAGQANGVVEAPGVEPHGAGRDDAEVAADEVAAREEAESELDALAAKE